MGIPAGLPMHGCNLPARSIPTFSRLFIDKVLAILMVTVRFDTNLLSILLRCPPSLPEGNPGLRVS